MNGIYLLIGDETKGPFTEDEVRQMVRRQEATLDTLHAVDGAGQWRPLKTRLQRDPLPRICAYGVLILILLAVGSANQERIDKAVMKLKGIPVPLDDYEWQYIEAPKEIERALREKLIGVQGVSRISQRFVAKPDKYWIGWTPYTATVDGVNEFGGPIREEVGVVVQYDGARIAVIVWPKPKEFREAKSFYQVHREH